MPIKRMPMVLIALFVILSLVMGACGSATPEPAPAAPQPAATEAPAADEPAAEPEPTEAPAAEPAATEAPAAEPAAEEPVDPDACNLEPPAAPVTINMIGWSFAITDFYAEELEKCSQVENLTINANLLASADAQEQVRLALSSGGDSPFDIVHGANAQVAEWGGPGWLLPLNDLVETYWDQYNLGDIPEKAWEGVTLDGNIYGVPMVGNTLHLIYRQDVLDELGIPAPETYDDVIAMCNAIGLDNPDWDMPFTINLSAGWAWEIEFFQFLRAYGSDFLDEANMPAFNGPEGVKAVEKLVEVADACMGIDGFSFGLNDQEVAVQLGTLPATNMWASRAANMSDPERTDIADLIGYAPAPRLEAGGPRAGSAWNDFYMIPAKTTNDPDLIFRVIMEATDEQSQKNAAKVGMTTRLATAEFGGPYLPAAVQTVTEGIGIYDKNQAVGIVRAKLGEFLPLVGTGEMTAQEALDAAAEAYITEATAQGFITP
jgi:ABC-type glycerol-3-phosphate transport system substrate-binding protein